MLPLILTHVSPSNNLILHKGGNNNLTFKPQLKKENVSRCPNKSSNMYFLSLVFLFKDANKKNLGCFSFYLRVHIVWIIGNMKQIYTCRVFNREMFDISPESMIKLNLCMINYMQLNFCSIMSS